MKKLLLLLAALGIIAYGFSQTNPSRKIRKAFSEKYTEAEGVKWEPDGERQPEWTARYTMGGDDMLTKYSFKGEWIYTLAFINPDELPVSISEELDTDYEGYPIIKAARMEAPDFSGYAAAIEKGDNRFEFQFTHEGKIIRRNLKSVNLY